MKALVVTYCPRGEQSNTKKLLDAAVAVLKAKKAVVETLDLTKDLPDLFGTEHIAAYIDRNYMGKKLSPAQAAAMKKADRMTAQLKDADVVVLAAPMYNFSLPGAVKAWFDSVMLKGETWDFAPTGYVGLLKGKKALFLSSSGGGPYEGQIAFLEHSASLAKVNFDFMGMETETAVAPGMNRLPEKAPEIVAQGQAKARAVLEKWLA